MAYLIVTMNQQEIDRRDLSAAVVLGRAPECDVAVRDIHLSRRHCRVEPVDGRWAAMDLGSKNGTTLNGERIDGTHLLNHGDVLRLGRVRVWFGAGSLSDADLRPLAPAPVRPADPTEALSGTLAGFELLEAGEAPPAEDDRPLPRPEPKIPAAYEREDVYSLLTTIASSSWDSIYAEAKQPLRAARAEADVEADLPRRVARPRSPIDLSLQASPLTEAELNGLRTPLRAWRLPRLRAGRVGPLKKWDLRSLRRKLPALAAGLWISAILVLAGKCWTGGPGPAVTPPADSANVLDDAVPLPTLALPYASDPRGWLA